MNVLKHLFNLVTLPIRICLLISSLLVKMISNVSSVILYPITIIMFMLFVALTIMDGFKESWPALLLAFATSPYGLPLLAGLIGELLSAIKDHLRLEVY